MRTWDESYCSTEFPISQLASAVVKMVTYQLGYQPKSHRNTSVGPMEQRIFTNVTRELGQRGVDWKTCHRVAGF